MKKVKIEAVTVLAIFLLSSSYVVLLNVEPALAPTSTPTVWIKIYRIQAIDTIEGLLESGADWHYYIWVWNGEEWLSTDDTAPSDQNDVIVDTVYSFDVETVSLSVRIALLEDDFWTASDLADISGYSGGGYDNYDGTLPRGAEYRGNYDLRTNELTGDEVIVEGGNFKTSGDYDGSTGSDENDANLWFSIWDNYGSPQADAGLGETVYTYEKVNFDGSGSTASSGSSLVKYQWDFENDGIFDAEGEKASFTYTKKGKYTVVLKVTDNLDKSDTDTVVITVLNRSPEASFSYSPTEPTIQDNISFSDTSEDEDGTIDSWSWNFGDSTTSTLRNPTHQYEDKGTYTVKLTAIDNDGATDSITKTVTIYNLEPIADFSHSPASQTTGEDVQFTDESEDPEGKQLSFSWDFGDGYTSSLRNPTHKYESARTYTVILTVTDDEGANDTISKTVTIKQKSFLEPGLGQVGGIPLWVILVIIIASVSVVAVVVVIKRRKPSIEPS